MTTTITGRRHTARIFTTALIALSLLLAAPLRADPGDVETLRHTQDLRFNFGFASAVGVLGVTYSVSPVPALELEAGLGWGWSGMQLSLMPKLSLGDARHRFIAGVGASASLDPDGRSEGVHVGGWLNAELGYSFRASSHWSILVAGGVTAGLAGQMHALCLGDCDERRDRPGLDVKDFISPTVRVASGFWF